MEVEYETRFKGVCNYGDSGGQSTDACYPNRCPNAYIHDIAPRKISWGANQKTGRPHHFFVEFNRDDNRADFKVRDYNNQCAQVLFSKSKLVNITVKVDEQIVRRYDFDYKYSQPPVRSYKGRITWGHLLLQKVTQFGKEGQGSLPAYTFNYYLDAVNRFNNTLLKSADNGYGGKVTFFYQGPHKVWTCTTKDKCAFDRPGEFVGGSYGMLRNILVKTKTEDGMGSSFETHYQYFSDVNEGEGPAGRGFVDCDFDHWWPCLSSFEFLGYQAAEVTTYKLNDPSTPVAKSKTYFTNQSQTGANGQYIRQPDACFNVDPRRGKAFKTEIYTPDGSKLLAKNESSYLVKPGYIPNPPHNGALNCRHRPSLEKQPAFVAKKQDDNYQYTGSETHTKTEYGPYDNYGNLKRQIEYGDVNKNGDERTIHLGFYPNTEKWILNKVAWSNVFEGVQPENQDIPELKTQIINFYDNQQEFDKPPLKGNLTMVKRGRYGQILVEEKMDYDEYGNLISQTDPNGNISTTTYDNTYHLYPLVIRNPLGHEVKMEYDFVLGAPTKIIDANGAVTEVTYDSFGRRLKVAKQPDSLTSPTFIFAYQDSAPAVTKTQAKIDENQYTVSWQIVNGLGQAIQTRTRAEVNGAVKDLLVTTQYDSLGRKIFESQPYEASLTESNFPSYTLNGWEEAPKNEFTYDDLGRVVATKDALGRTTTKAYDGWTTTTTDANGRSSAVTQDAFGNTLTLRDPLNNETHYEYDILSNLIKVTTLASASRPDQPLVTTISYDALSRKIAMNDPDLGRWQYQYDANGNLTSQTDAKNQTIRFEYDGLNRAVKKIYPDGQTITFEYDQGANAKGRRTKMADLTGLTEYNYDLRGRLIKERKVIEDEEAVTEYGYNSANALVWTKYPDGEIVRQEYNPLGQLKRISGESNYLTDITYTVLGATAQASFGNQTETAYQYDLTGRLKEIWTKNQSIDLIKWDYSQDPVGNITRIEDLLSSDKSLTFTYDPLDRLTTASGYYSAEYEYDSVGNMLKKVEGDSFLTMLYTDPLHAHAPKVVNGFEYQYDANGNLIEDESRFIEWNYDNKPIKITMKETGVVTEFAYDGDGRRVIKRVLGGEAPTPTPSTVVTPTVTSILSPTPTATTPATPTPVCPRRDNGNLDCDSQGVIDEVDLTILLSGWGTEEVDITGDGVVNEADLEKLLNNWALI